MTRWDRDERVKAWRVDRAGRGEVEQMEQSGAIRGKAGAGRKGKTQRDRSSQAK